MEGKGGLAGKKEAERKGRKKYDKWSIYGVLLGRSCKKGSIQVLGNGELGCVFRLRVFVFV